jgi:O-antigen ligase
MTDFGGARLLSREGATAAAAILGAAAVLDIPEPAKLACLALAAFLIGIAGVLPAVCLVCLALPFTMFTISVGQSEWSPLELTLLTCWLATGLEVGRRTIAERNLQAVGNAFRPHDLAVISLALAIIGGLSLTWIVEGGDLADSLREYRRVVLEPLILVPAIMMIRREGRERDVLPWLVYPAIAVSLLAVGQVFLQESVVEIGNLSRPIGTFTHPNNLAFYLERTIWFAPLIIVPRHRTSLPLPWLGAAFIGLGCALTFSRGSMLAIALGGVVYFWEFVRPRWRVYLGGVAAIGVLAFVSRELFGDSDSTSSRASIWRASIEMLRDHPFGGVGLDQFLGQYGRRYVEPEGWPERYTSHPHNIVLDFWLRLGLPGLLILWLLMEATWRRVHDAIEGSPGTVRRAAVAMLVAGFAHGLIDNGFFLADLASFTWMGLALATSKRVIGNRDHA